MFDVINFGDTREKGEPNETKNKFYVREDRISTHSVRSACTFVAAEESFTVNPAGNGR